MNPVTLLSELQSMGARVWTERGNLRVSAPAGVLTQERRDLLAAHKPELLSFLELATKLHSQHAAIVPLQPLGSLPPVFAAAGHNGDVFCYRALAEHLGPAQPFYGLQPLGYDDGTVPLRSVESLADYFADQLTAFRPKQPCTVVGYCAGGTIAFALVRRLQELGHPVSRLVLYGAPLCTWYRQSPQAMAIALHMAKQQLRLLGAVMSQRGYARAKALVKARFPSRSYEYGDDDGVLERRRHVELATAAAVARYVPRQLDIHADIIMPGSYIIQTEKSLLGWRRFVASHASFVGPVESSNDTMLLPTHASHYAGLYRRSANLKH